MREIELQTHIAVRAVGAVSGAFAVSVVAADSTLS